MTDKDMQINYLINSLSIDNFEPKTRERLRELLEIADRIKELLENYPFHADKDKGMLP